MNGDIYGQDVNGVPRPYSPTGLPVPPRTPTSDPQVIAYIRLNNLTSVRNGLQQQFRDGMKYLIREGTRCFGEQLSFLLLALCSHSFSGKIFKSKFHPKIALSSSYYRFLGHQTATVTQMTLDDKELKFKVEEFAKALVNELLYDLFSATST